MRPGRGCRFGKKGTATITPDIRENGGGGETRAGTGPIRDVSALEETLWLLNRVVAATVTGIVVTDPHLPDNPIIYHNPAFERISGYAADEIDGHNCRFLQGRDTEPDAVDEIRRALRGERECHVVLRNYRKDGTPFWNELALSPVHDADGRLTHFVGVQNDITRRKDAEVERDALLEQQKRIAETLQRALLLTPPESLHGLEVGTQYEPAWDEAQFGGDFFDAFALGEDRVALLVGDVTGKGLQAAAHTAEVKYAARVLLRELGDPAAALSRLNHFLVEAQRLDDRDRDSLVCLAVAVVDTRSGHAAVAAAGIEPPLLVRAGGEAHEIRAGGMMLGIDAKAEYRTADVTLGKGDLLLMVTDGITEARRGRLFFGYDGLLRAASAAAASPGPLDAVGRAVVASARTFAGGKFSDDVCLLLARRR